MRRAHAGEILNLHLKTFHIFILLLNSMFEIAILSFLGNYYEPLPTQYEAGNNIEEENEKMTDQLKDKIHVLKSVSFGA